MSTYLGDYYENHTDLNFKFTTRSLSGVPTALTGGAIEVYRTANTTQSTAGIVLTASFDSIIGMNHVNITLTDAFYLTGNDYQVVLSAGTVDSVSVVGEVVAHFSIENRFDETNIVQINSVDCNGAGTSGDKWRA